MTDPSPKEKTRSQCSVIAVKKYRVICLFLASFFSDFFAKEVFKEATMLLHHDDVLSMEISSAKRKRERLLGMCVCVCIMMEASQSREEEPLAPDV